MANDTPQAKTMETTTPQKATAAAADAARLDAAVSASRARREANRNAPRQRDENLGGMRLKMSVNGTIDGHHMYWENDEDGAIEQLLYEGFEFVLPEEVRMQSVIVQDADLGNRVSRYVGKKSDGSPLRAYLLKCPDDIWADREASRYRQADEWDSAIRQGKIQHGDGRYKPKGTDINLDTKFRKEY